MDNRSEVREFLVSRRAKITPQEAGLPAYGGHRRVPGLRREEVAMLAGVSAEYYARLERGNLSGVSESVLESLSRALKLDEAERAHLFDLARTANAGPGARRRPAQQQIRPGIQLLLDSMTDAAAYVRNGRLDIIAANRLGRALYAPVFDDPVRPVNLARFRFLNPRARDFFPDWDESAHTTVALLRTEAGRDPYDRSLTDLVGELATRSEEFRTLWAAHNVRLHHTGVKNFHHPVVGDLRLPFEAMPLPADPGLTLTAFSAEPGTAAHDALALLAGWASTLDPQASEPGEATRTPDLRRT
ncbi:helix-turn-helix transcriptional regulator [Nonomuraea sp. JJY05]|uniref:helix-turn-helix transcriptional regulator n=1 Tax=Nonomuraea sp. JJY05 TaxID=3350255 RepID=UPI00373FC581